MITVGSFEKKPYNKVVPMVKVNCTVCGTITAIPFKHYKAEMEYQKDMPSRTASALSEKVRPWFCGQTCSDKWGKEKASGRPNTG